MIQINERPDPKIPALFARCSKRCLAVQPTFSHCIELIPAFIERKLVCNPESQIRSEIGGLMQTVALILFWWVAANLVIAGIWTVYCVWPRRSHACQLAGALVTDM